MAEKAEFQKGKTSLTCNSTILRNRIKESKQGEFINDLSKHNEEEELQRGRSPSQFREIGNSRIETNTESEMRREEDQLCEMGAGPV